MMGFGVISIFFKDVKKFLGMQYYVSCYYLVFTLNIPGCSGAARGRLAAVSGHHFRAANLQTLAYATAQYII